MTLSTTIKVTARPTAGEGRTYPASIQSDWQKAVTAVNAIDDSASGAVVGGKVVNPALIDRSANRLIEIAPGATHLLVALKYNSDATSSTDPVIRVFGSDDNGVWHNLINNAGTPTIEATLVTAETTDCITSGYRMTMPHQFDLQGSRVAIVAVQTAFAVSGGTVSDAEIWVKAINSR